MAKLTTQDNIGRNVVGGGNLGIYIQMERKTDGSNQFQHVTGTDVHGDASGTEHIIGSQVDSGFNRNASAIWENPITILDNDIDHLNMLDEVAVYVPNAADLNPEDKLEDGTIIGGDNGPDGDPTKAYFLFVLFGGKLGGKERARVFIGQFGRDGGFDQKAAQRNKFKMKVQSVDGHGTTPAMPTHTRCAGMVAPTLGTTFAMGKWVSGS